MIIIGILAAIAIPTFLAQRDNARQGAMESDIRNLAAQATSCSASANGSYATCDRAALQAAPYNFTGTDRVTCVVPAGTLTASRWAGSCSHTDLPAAQSASFDTNGTGRVETNGY